MPTKKFIGSCMAAGLFLAAGCLYAQSVSPNTNLTAREEQIIDAAKVDAIPRLNGAMVFGARPGSPFLYTISATGNRPMTFSVKNLPAGLQVDSKTGEITGSLLKPTPNGFKGAYYLTRNAVPGEYIVTLCAKNAKGEARKKFRIVCGNMLTLTPPMGWNSYDAFGDNVVESEVLANARYVAEKMQPVGWDTVVVDYCWSDPGAHDNNRNARTNAPLAMDVFGRLLPATNRFPSAVEGRGFRPLADQAHALGLKFGIHIMRGIPRNSVAANLPIEGSSFTAAEAGNTNSKCVWCPDMFGASSNAAGQAWYDSCARLWAAWGVDYIKVDDLSSPYHAAEIEMIRHAIDRCGRSIVFSTSPGETSIGHAAHVAANANLWRVSGDFWDNWKSLDHEFTLGARWHDFVGPGHWPDADMLPVGHLSVGNRSVGPDRFTQLTRDEQLTHISLWSLLPSPLMVGANLPDNDDWTTALLTNPEVLAVNQDSLGKPAQRMTSPNIPVETWKKELTDGSFAVGFFNRTSQPLKINVPWRNLGFGSQPKVRDLWLRKDLGREKSFSAELPPHGCILLKVK